MPDIEISVGPDVKVPRGPAGAPQLDPWKWKPGKPGCDTTGMKYKKRATKLSEAYTIALNTRVPHEIAKALNVPDDTLWSEAIAMQVLKRSVGQIKDSEICFTAITEIRESTEGKTPERMAIGGGNVELDALAKAIAGGPAKALPEDVESQATFVESGDTEGEPQNTDEESIYSALPGVPEEPETLSPE